jgi:hypothetical protein
MSATPAFAPDGPSDAIATRSYSALDFRFRVETNRPEFAALVDRVFAACDAGDADPGDAVYTCSALDAGAGSTVYTVDCDGVTIASSAASRYALDYLVWHVNQRVVEASGRRLLVHAGAVEHDRRIAIVPAESGGGKSTLVAALVRAGFGYATDETVAVERDTLLVEGYRRALALKRGSWPLFPGVDDGALPSATYATPSRYAPASVLGGRDQREAAPARWLLVPVRGDGAGPALTPILRADALVLLVEQAFNFERFERGLSVLGEIVRGCDCYRVDVSDLDRACGAVLALVTRDDVGVPA